MTPPPLPASESRVARESFARNNTRGSSACIVLALGLYFAFIINWLAPVGLRFTPGPLNSAVLFTALLFPCVALALLMWRHRGASRTVGAIFVGLLALPSLFLASCILLFGDQEGMERLRDGQTGGYHFVVYRTNGGATTSFGICVRQELLLPLGLHFVREVYRHNRSNDATVKVLAPDAIKIISSSNEEPKAEIIRLRPLVTF